MRPKYYAHSTPLIRLHLQHADPSLRAGKLDGFSAFLGLPPRQPAAPGAVQLEFLEAQKKAAASGGRFTAQLITQGMGLTTASPLMVALFVVMGLQWIDTLGISEKYICESERSCNGKRTKQV